MNIISKYLSKTIIEVFLGLALLFSSLFFLVGIVREVSSIGQNNYHLMEAVIYVLLQLPTIFVEMLPILCLLSGLISLGIFASSNELIIIRTSGYSIYRISWIVLRVAMVLCIISIFMQEYIAPQSYKLSINRKAFQKSGGNLVRTSSSFWLRDNNQFIAIEKIDKNNLFNVSKYNIGDDNQMQRVSFAKKVEIMDGAWHAFDVSTTIIGDSNTSSSFKKNEIWVVDIPLQAILVDSVYSSELTLSQLRRYVFSYLDKNAINNKHSLAFWERVLQPLSTIIMMLLAVPVIFGPLRTSSLGARSLVGILVGFSFYFMSKLLGPVSIVWQFPPFFAVITPIFVFGVVAWYMLKRYS